MKSCTRCSNMLTPDATYCYVCNSPQTGGFEDFELQARPSDVFLKVLCILTLIGSAISLISLPFSFAAYSQLDELGMDFPVALLALGGVVALGKLLGAIFMLMKKLTGLYIYTVAAVLSIISSIYSAINPVMDVPFAMVGVIFGLFFVIAFLIMYWLPVNRRVLS